MAIETVFTQSAGQIDPTLDKLFLSSFGKPTAEPRERLPPRKKAKLEPGKTGSVDSGKGSDESSFDSEPATEASNVNEDREEDDESLLGSNDPTEGADSDISVVEDSDRGDVTPSRSQTSRRKRKRANNGLEVEDVYLAKLSRQAANASLMPRGAAVAAPDSDAEPRPSHEPDEAEPADIENTTDENSNYVIPKHETQDDAIEKGEIDKAARTVFLGNVSCDAIRSKEVMKQLTAHLESCLKGLPADKEGKSHKIQSFRFRSVAFSTTSIPRKAAFAKKELMDATTRSTNAYAVYTTARAAREAVRLLNGTVVLDRHLRVDSVAHPSPVDHQRCVFVGNLGFVDDESLIQAAQNGEGPNDPGASHSKKNKSKPPSDVEEGLWRTFGTVGSVESVRVVRDKTTRVGKGIAYVQFKDQVAVEKALELDGKAFPPMLPRGLRITRAKKPSKTAGAMNRKKEQIQAVARALEQQKGRARKAYNPKINYNTRSTEGRAGKLFGRAAAAQIRKGMPNDSASENIRRPEDFVFEGHRAKVTDGKKTMNLKPIKSSKRKPSKPSSRSSKRGAAFKAAGRRN